MSNCNSNSFFASDGVIARISTCGKYLLLAVCVVHIQTQFLLEHFGS